jgi:hypothetical protein
MGTVLLVVTALSFWVVDRVGGRVTGAGSAGTGDAPASDPGRDPKPSGPPSDETGAD